MNDDDKRPKQPKAKPAPAPSAPPKRGRGRPSIGDRAKRHNIAIRVTPEEYRLWKRLAGEQGMTMVEFITEPLRRSLKRKGEMQ